MTAAKAHRSLPRAKRAKRRKPLAKIRHDLRTPINHIIGFSEILLEEAPGKVPGSFLEDLQKIRAGGGRLLELINQHLSAEAFPVATTDQHQLCHELRTPVNHIIGYTELLSEQCEEAGLPQFQGDLEKINLAARTSRPSSPGISKSNKTRSNFSARTSLSASRPFGVVVTS